MGSREGVFVSLPKGMKNRESSQGFELTRTARAARFPTHTPRRSRCSVSFHSLSLQCQLTAYQGLGEGCAGKIATPVSIRWPLPHLGEIVRSVQFKTVARLRFTDRFTVDFRELSLKRTSRFLPLSSPATSLTHPLSLCSCCPFWKFYSTNFFYQGNFVRSTAEDRG